MAYKVIFDTNRIRSEKSLDDFFGGRSELQKFLRMSEIIIPEMVIDEIKSQKTSHLNTAKEKFVSNPFHSLIDIEEKTKNFSIDKHISDLYKTEEFPHKVIRLTRETALQDIKNLCLKKQPPFTTGETDKGFKDACIYFTILDYLKEIGNEEVYLVTEDGDLIEAFKDEPQVITVKDHSEFSDKSGTFLYDYYFTEKLEEHFEKGSDYIDITEHRKNSEGNWILEVSVGNEVHDDTFFVEVDSSSKEILGDTDDKFLQDIKNLIASSSYEEANLYIPKLKDFMQYFTDEEIHNLLEASMKNGLIQQIETDRYVKGFLLDIYEDNRIPLSAELNEILKNALKVKKATYDIADFL